MSGCGGVGGGGGDTVGGGFESSMNHHVNHSTFFGWCDSVAMV